MDGSVVGGFWWVKLWVPIDGWGSPPLRFMVGRFMDGRFKACTTTEVRHFSASIFCFILCFVFFFFFLVLVSNPCHAWKLNFVRVCGGGGGRASDLVLVDYEFILNCILDCGGCGVVWWWLLVVGSCVGVVNYVWWVVNIILMCYIYYFNI